MLSALLTSGALSDPILIDTVVQHWLLAIERDCIAVDLSFESPSMCIICKKLIISIISWRLMHRFDNPTSMAHPLHHTVSVTLISPDSKQCGEDRH